MKHTAAGVLMLITGLGTSFAFGYGLLPNRTIVIRVDFAAAALLCGSLGVALVGVAAARIRARLERHRTSDTIRRAALEDRRQFVRRLDHELANPLTAIRAALANITTLVSADEATAAIAMLNAQIVRVAAVIGDLRKLADLDLRPLESGYVDSSSLLAEVVDVALTSEHGSGRAVPLSLPGAPWPLPNVVGDRDLLFLALHNLIDNALKYAPPNARVEVRGYEDDGMVVVEVADSGPGISDEEVPYVWDELYRGMSARGIAGSGLGLSLVKAVCQRHGAEVTLRSRVGLGTVVTVRIPAAVTER